MAVVCRRYNPPTLRGEPVNESSFLREIREEAMLDVARRAVVLILEARFPDALSPVLRQQILRATSLGQIAYWIPLAATCASPAAFAVVFDD